MGRRFNEPAWDRFVDRLRDERIEAGLTQDDVAEYLGTSQSAISEWERHLAHPGVGYVDRWAGLFGLQLDFVEGGEQDG